MNYPMFVFCRGRSSDQQTTEIKRPVYSPPSNYNRQNYTDDEDDDETEEFVIV